MRIEKIACMTFISFTLFLACESNKVKEEVNNDNRLGDSLGIEHENLDNCYRYSTNEISDYFLSNLDNAELRAYRVEKDFVENISIQDYHNVKYFTINRLDNDSLKILDVALLKVIYDNTYISVDVWSFETCDEVEYRFNEFYSFASTNATYHEFEHRFFRLNNISVWLWMDKLNESNSVEDLNFILHDLVQKFKSGMEFYKSIEKE